jgi:DNA-directed RNA polymerase specialized sigma subunit
MGDVGEKLYECVYVKGFSLQEAKDCLQDTLGICEPLEKMHEMLDKMRGRERLSGAVTGVEIGDCPVVGKLVSAGEGVEIVISDPAKNPEELLMRNQDQRASSQVITELLEQLSGEERLMIRMRFPALEDEQPRSLREIAVLLRLSEKAIDARIRRILVRFRENLLNRGLTLNDFIDM